MLFVISKFIEVNLYRLIFFSPVGLQNLFAQLALCGSQPLYKVVLVNCRQTIKLLIYLFSLIAQS